MTSENPSSQITVQRRELSGVLGASEEDDLEVLGRAMVYRAGDVLVPRDWLLGRCRDLNIPDRIIPSETTPHSAYKRAQAQLITSNPQNGDTRTDRRFVKVEGVNDALKVTLDLKDGDGNVNHLTADVFHPAELVGEEGGKWVHHDLGHFNYDKETQWTVAVKSNDCPEGLESLWDELQDRAKRLHDQMERSHTGSDLRHMIYLNMILNSPPEWPDIIPLIDQGGLYFVPEGELVDHIDSLATIFREANQQFKIGGAEMAIRTFEIVDSDEKREWVESRVRQSLEKMVDDVIDEAFSALDEGEETVDEIVDTVAERIGQEAHGAEQYNDLLQAKLDIESMLANRASAVGDDEKQELIQQAMSQVEV